MFPSNLVNYALFKFVHLLGVVLLVGNVTVTAVWKVFADRTGVPAVIAFAQRMVTITDWTLTAGGVALLAVGGYGMAITTSMPLFTQRWLGVGQGMFALSGLIWIFVLIPTQIQQARAVRAFAVGQSAVPQSYRVLSRRWILWGVIATLPLLIAVFVMTSRI